MSFALSPSAKNFIRRMLRYAGGCSGLVADFEGDAGGEAAVDADSKVSLRADNRMLLDPVACDFGELPIRPGVLFGRRTAPLDEPYLR
jgi:hypothetical protein